MREAPPGGRDGFRCGTAPRRSRSRPGQTVTLAQRAGGALVLLALCLLPAFPAAADASALAQSPKLPQKSAPADAGKAPNKTPPVVTRPAAGQAPAADSDGERILSYAIDVRVNADNTLDVEETIRAHAAGVQIRRGLYRDFPTRYRDRYGNRVTVDFAVIGLLRDGKAEPWFTERIDNGVRVNFGNDDFLRVPADYTYTLRYRTDRQIGFFDDHDELYWNAIGTAWDFPIEQASVRVQLPQPVPIADLRAEGYTGPQGDNAQDYAATLPAPGQARWTLTRPLAPREGMTIVLSFPKGILTPPDARQKLLWLLKDNRGLLVALGTLLLVLGWQLVLWLKLGRDPKPGVIITRYEPPPGLSPASARFIRQRFVDDRCLSADLLALAVQGLLRIRQDPRRSGPPAWVLERVDATIPAGLPEPERILLNAIFDKDTRVRMDTSQGDRLFRASANHASVLRDKYSGRMFHGTEDSKGCLMPSAIAVLGFGIAIWLAHGAGHLLMALTAVATLGVVIAFWSQTEACTSEGRTLLDAIEGLKTYLEVADRDDLARLQGPEAPPTLDAGRYAALLPWAMALDVEAAWTDKFTQAVGKAAAESALAGFAWYEGANLQDLSHWNSQFGDQLARTVQSEATYRSPTSHGTSSSSYSPGSFSGSGGGGFSGGGGGGGGGGGR